MKSIFYIIDFSGSILNWIVMFIGLVLGLAILYGLLFLFVCLVLWLGQLTSGGSINRIVTEPLQMPIDFLGKNLSFALTFLIPLGFVVTVPVKVFLSMEPFSLIFISLAVACATVGLSSLLWNLALKHYTSASS